jgi:hypothetical protein
MLVGKVVMFSFTRRLGQIKLLPRQFRQPIIENARDGVSFPTSLVRPR